MKKKTIWTIELPADATRIDALEVAIHDLNGKVVNIKENILPLTDEECRFWRRRWVNLPDTDFYATDSQHKIVYSVKRFAGKLKVGVAKCRNEDTFNFAFGRALAEARCLGDRKLERALLHFTPEQIDKFF